MALESLGVGVATEVAKDFLYATKREVSYLLCFNNIVKEHETEVGKLVQRRDYVLKCAQDANNRTEHIGDDDRCWIKEAGDLIDESQRLEEQRKAKGKCFMGWSPNCIWQYRFGKKMAKRKENATKLIDLSPFKNFQRLATLPNIEYYSSKDFVDLQSRKLTCSKLLEALEDEQSSTIGLYGMGGSGKTTLVKQVGKQVKESKLFEKVVFVVVSNSPEVKKIQDSIANSLGLEFKEQEELNRAKRLWLRLTIEQKILIILDDIWEKLDFEAIGIPYNENRKGCKVLLTTRSKRVCSNMQCQSVIPLSLLSDYDAWILFQKYASISNESPQGLKDVAQQITIQCKGLPVAIAAVASTLKELPSIQDWKVALRSLKKSKPLDNIDEDLNEVYKCLKLSYDSLKSEKSQNLFRLCSLFPEDYEISLEDLTRYVIGLGLFGDVHCESYENLRSQVSIHRKKLLDSCLLQNTKEGKFVIMHDLVREVAHLIANKEIQVIMGPEDELKALVDDAMFKESVKFLWFHNIVEFPSQLDCPKLRILVMNIQSGEQSLEVKDTFFIEMKDLQVVTLTWMKKWSYESSKQISIPQSIQFLENLRTLRLNNWLLGDISAFGSLKKLETLEFDGCSIEELPTAILELKNLRLLSLVSCLLDKNPFVVMGRLSQVEELYFLKANGSQWKVDGENVSEFLNGNCQWTRLERYQIQIGANLGLYNSVKKTEKIITRALSVERFDASTSNETMKDIIQRAEVLHLQEVQGGYRSIMPDLVEAVSGLNEELIELRLDGCRNIECLVDFGNHSFQLGSFFSQLVKLELKCMDDFKELCEGHPPSDLFRKLEKLHLNKCSQLHSPLFVGNLKLCNLKVLKVKACPLLTSLFTLSIAQSLVLLEELYLSDCGELKYIIGHNADLTNGENEDNIIQEKDHYNKQIMLPALRVVEFKKLPIYISIFPTSGRPVDRPVQLDSTGLELTSSTAQASKYKSSEQQRLPMPTAQCFARQGLNLCHLRELMLSSIPTLVSLFTPSTAQTMSVLEGLRIKNCEGLKQIITNEEGDQDHNHGSVSIFPKLKELSVEKCNLLKFIFPVSLARGFVELRSMEVIDCAVLEFVFGEYHDDDHLRHQNEDEIHINIELPALKLLGLIELPKIVSICPKYYSPIWPSLNSITMEKCRHQLTVMSITDCITKESQAVTTNYNNSPTNSELQPLYIQLNLEGLWVKECLDESIFQLKGPCTDGPHNPLTSRLEYMWLVDLPELWHICNGPMLLSFQNLGELQVSGCGKLVTIFSVSVLRSLPQLRYLEITKCDQLEHIVEDNEEDQVLLNRSSLKVCFPELWIMTISECNKLQYLFSICNPNELPKLKSLIIGKASQLEQVFRCGMGNIEDRDKTLLPALESLTLMELPCLINVCHGFKLQSQRELKVVNCPQLPHEYQNAEEQGREEAFSNGQGSHEAEEEEEETVKERNVIELSTGSVESKEVHMAAAQTSSVDSKTALTTSQKATDAASQTNKNEGHPSNFSGGITTIESTFELPQQLNDSNSLNTKVNCRDLIHDLNRNLKSPIVVEINANLSNHFLLDLNNEPYIEDLLVQEPCVKDLLVQEDSHLSQGASLNIVVEKGKEPMNEEEEEKKGDIIVEGKSFAECREARAAEQKIASFTDDSSSQNITPAISVETIDATHEDKLKLQLGIVLTDCMEGINTASETSTSNVLNKANEIILDLPKHGESLMKDSMSEHVSDHFNREVNNSGGAPAELPVEEYATFRDIGAIKIKHIPLLEQAIANYPSLWAWSEKVKLPQIMKQCAYTILGDLLEFLASTRWSDLNEAKRVEFESLVNGLETLGFDIQWLANTQSMIMQSKIDEDTINHMKSLDGQVKSVEMILNDLDVNLQEAKAELHKMKSELDALRTKPGNINDFIGF